MKSKAAQALTNFPAESQSTVPLWDVLCLRLTSEACQRPSISSVSKTEPKASHKQALLLSYILALIISIFTVLYLY